MQARFSILDGLRGLAAMLVVGLHIEDVTGRYPLRHAYLAVDLFFLLSGFVLSQAYEHRLSKGLGAASFLQIRFVRLYPIYFLGLLVALPLYLHRESGAAAFIGLGSALLMLPTLYIVSASQVLFSINTPAWSLFFELLVNYVFAAVHKHLTQFAIALICVLSFSLLAWVSFFPGSRGLDYGWTFRSAPVGLIRVAFSFFLGVALSRHHFRSPIKAGTPQSGRAMILFLIAFLILAAPELPIRTAWYDLAVVSIAFPAILWSAARTTTDSWVECTCAVLGRLSYPIYMLHLPLSQWFEAAKAAGWAPAPAVGLTVGYYVLLLGCSWLAANAERPARQFLERRLKQRRLS